MTIDVEKLPPRCAAIVAFVIEERARIEALHTGSIVLDCTPEQLSPSFVEKAKTRRTTRWLAPAVGGR